ncbi:IclR family transcriptional regulator [Amycolatopsis sp. WAC 01375]|uniref:IclR family transcriptional regulator n=1 Tax=unclassified Amycolatopsis TaxID=2618356 RepID=UPI000F77588B|nr:MULTISPECIES: IclR family transcriptional regulator [unclassified Amycolatopsis]RSM71906.1 IclR family transcriptional regulator [Amycolatopsis sp. WAC 01375]RSN31999.1 IclR family transcriptional regulator [Amycolatopsis sp. WAC 01416]
MRNQDAGNATPSQVQSVDRAISVLELLARNGETGITEIAGELGVHKSTASRLLSVLENRGLVEQLGERGKYAIGFGIVRLAGAAAGRMDLAKIGRQTCLSLAETLGETVNIAIADDGVAINISQARGSAAISTQNWTGQRTPLHATSSGKVLLAYLGDAERKRLLRRKLEQFTHRTTTDPEQLTAELERVAEDGYAACFEELELGMHAVAVPVYGPGGEVVAAMSASGPSYRLSKQRVRQIVRPLAEAAADLSAQLGHFAD